MPLDTGAPVLLMLTWAEILSPPEDPDNSQVCARASAVVSEIKAASSGSSHQCRGRGGRLLRGMADKSSA